MTPGEEIEGIEEKECYKWRRCMVNPGKTEGRDGYTGSRDKFRQGWSLATLPNVAQVPLFSAGFLTESTACANSVLNAYIFSGTSLPQLYPWGQAQ